jgi:predicted flap endonuclease-1-like 5' DNA nuclease
MFDHLQRAALNGGVENLTRGGTMANLVDIEGIGPAYAEKLAAQGLKTTDDLLGAAAAPKGRQDLEAATGISGAVILKWVNRADLFRVKGVGTQYSDLLEATGVDTVVELGKRRADNLTAKMAEVNTQKKLVRQLPTEGQVAAWIEEAKTLPRAVTY